MNDAPPPHSTPMQYSTPTQSSPPHSTPLQGSAPVHQGGIGAGVPSGLTDPQASFVVHLDSLTSFARELEYQISSLARPQHELEQVGTTPMRLGDFPEAQSLQQATTTSAQQLLQVLDEVKSAMEFAREVTTVVARGYEQADSDVAATIGTGLGTAPSGGH